MADPRICSIEGCDKPHHCRAMCRSHYEKSKRQRQKDNPTKFCIFEGCKAQAEKRGWCSTHYRRWHRRGDPNTVLPHAKKKRTIFIEEVAVKYQGDECLIFPFPLSKSGYGSTSREGRRTTASNEVCRIVNGPPPSPKHECCHSCNNPSCVAPKHLRWGTSKENKEDKVANGTLLMGEKHGCAKLTEADVRHIRSINDLSQGEIAILYGVSISAISMIRIRKRWKHIP